MTRRHVLLGAAAGAIVVALDAAGIAATHLDWIDELLALAPLVIVPLGLPLVGFAALAIAAAAARPPTGTTAAAVPPVLSHVGSHPHARAQAHAHEAVR